VSPQPKSVRLRTYNVGFGDCLLLTVAYASKFPDGRMERHMLIDCGSKTAAEYGPSLADIATVIADHCGNKLDVVVATHRHSDHIKGFGDTHAREILDALNPGFVIRPWTDNPDFETTTGPFKVDAESQQFIKQLDALQAHSELVSKFSFDSEKLAKRAAELADLGFKNTQAVAMLEQWGNGDKAAYVTAGEKVKLKAFPGVTVQVLGPPALKEVPRLTSYARESEQYWLQLGADAGLLALVGTPPPNSIGTANDKIAQPGGAGAGAWLIRELNDERLTQGLDIVEGFDDVLNNTSVILLITVGTRSLLLAGDAQAENWSFTLECALGKNNRKLNASLQEQLAMVDVYKVGHHGSRNATPKDLTGLWAGRKKGHNPLVSVLSTKHGVFDKSVEGAVPKETLITKLKTFGPVYNTDDLGGTVWWIDIEASTTDRKAFRMTTGKPKPAPAPTLTTKPSKTKPSKTKPSKTTTTTKSQTATKKKGTTGKKEVAKPM
jgi:beta-lactamase superfamily II metal-dependent hydrolase